MPIWTDCLTPPSQFTLLSPCAFLAKDYIVLPRLAAWLGAVDALIIRPSKVLRIFLWSDGNTFFLQMSGAYR